MYFYMYVDLMSMLPKSCMIYSGMAPLLKAMQLVVSACPLSDGFAIHQELRQGFQQSMSCCCIVSCMSYVQTKRLDSFTIQSLSLKYCSPRLYAARSPT